MRRRELLYALLMASVAVPLAAVAHAEPAKITILQVNDWDRFDGQDGQGGFPRLMSILEKENATADNVLFVHAGDAFSPSLLSGFDKGAHMVALLNETPLDLFVLGNHEFDFGPDIAKERIAEADFPVINSNVLDKGGELLAGTTETMMMDVAGYKLGFYGLTTPETEILSSPGYVSFEPVLETAQAMAQKLRGEGADLVIAVTHTGVNEDSELFRSGVADLILSGHDQDLRVEYNGRVSLTESYSQAIYVTAIDLTIDRVKRGDSMRLVWQPAYRVLESTDYEPSARGLELIKTYEDQLSKELDITIGKTTTPLDSRRATIRTEEAAIGNLIADAMRASVKADVALTNGGGIRADRVYDAGTTLTRRDIQSELPFGNKTVKLEVSGEDIVTALEHGFSQVEEVAGRFPQISGMEVKVDLSRPAGSRVQSVKIGGKNLDPSATYTLATNDFMARGGDGYDVFKNAKNIIDPAAARFMASQVIDYIADKGEVSPTVEGRITRVN